MSVVKTTLCGETPVSAGGNLCLKWWWLFFIKVTCIQGALCVCIFSPIMFFSNTLGHARKWRLFGYHGVDRKCTAKIKSEIPSFQCWLVSLSFFLPSIHTLNEGVYRKKEKGEGH